MSLGSGLMGSAPCFPALPVVVVDPGCRGSELGLVEVYCPFRQPLSAQELPHNLHACKFRVSALPCDMPDLG